MAEPLIYCQQHITEIINLFCCKCEEFVCVHCLVDSHQMHKMKHLIDSKEVIKGHLGRFFTTEKATITSKIKEVKDLALKELSDIDRDEKQICKQIEECAESEKNKIENHVKDLTENLHNTNASYRQRVQAIAETFTNTETRIAEITESGINIENIDWPKQVEVYLNIKKSVHGKSAIEKNKQDMKPRFVPINDNHDREIIIGVIEIGDNNEVSREESKVISLRTYSNLNTENPPEAYSERKQANTRETLEESSSDEFRNEYPVTIDLNSSIKQAVNKIIPTSEDNAWIICENKLFRLRGCVLEETSYSEKVDDMTTIGDGSVLLLQRQPCYIKRLLGKRILNFTHPGSNIPQCIHAISDNNVIVLCEVKRLFSSNEHDMKRTREVIQLDDNGVVQVRFNFQYDKDCIPIEIIVKNPSDMYILFKDAYYTPPVSTIVRIDLKTKKLDEDNVFNGAIGMDVSSQFICNGLCFEPNFKIIVADKNHHSILLIENMKYVKRVFVAEHGLDSPGALAFFNGILWVADVNKIHKFQYK